jgi:hypothetical protein
MRFAVHGPAVEVECFVPWLGPQVRRLLGPFAVADWPQGFVRVHGVVRPYEESDVMRHLSPAARPLPPTHDLLELYEDGERFWVVDERWGMGEINFLKGQWRSWLLPRPQSAPAECAEMAVLWPLAQLLRPRGLCLLPAASVERDGWAALLVCPFGVEPELAALQRDGYSVIGRRWTALREEDGRVALLHLPDGAGGGRSRNHAFCDAVLVAEPGRRAHATLRELDASSAAAVLRRAWPIAELHPSRRHSALPAKLAHLCRCAGVQLSRDPGEFVRLLDALRHAAGAGRIVKDAPQPARGKTAAPERRGDAAPAPHPGRASACYV